jgi:hypothetical protein
MVSAMVILATSFKKIPETEARINMSIIYDADAFKEGSDTIGFNNNSLLKWMDFQSALPAVISDHSVANSSVGFKFNASIRSAGKNIFVTVHVSSFFIRSKSWSLQSKQNDYILNHEQNHFYLARYGADLFRKNILRSKFSKSNISSQISKAYDDAWEAYVKIQAQYDKETEHSINKKNQAVWNKQVSNLIANCK